MIGIVGSRNSGKLSFEIMRNYIPKECSKIVSGGAKGVDTMAEGYALAQKIEFLKILPNYTLYGKTAPLIRNTEIVKQSDKVFAFWDYYSSGTAHTIKECIRLGVPVEIISIKGGK